MRCIAGSAGHLEAAGPGDESKVDFPEDEKEEDGDEDGPAVVAVSQSTMDGCSLSSSLAAAALLLAALAAAAAEDATEAAVSADEDATKADETLM